MTTKNTVSNANPKTVVHLLDFTPNAQRSLESFLLTLTERLNKSGWNSVFVFSGEPSEYIAKRLNALDAPYFCYKFPLNKRDIYALGEILQKFNPYVLQTHFLSKFHGSLRTLKRISGATHLIITDRSSGSPGRMASKLPFLVKLRARFASTYIDQIVCVSDFVRRRNIKMFFPDHKVCTVYNGVDTKRYLPTRFKGKAGFTIVFVGQLIPEKGVMTLLQAALRLASSSVLPFQVLIAGRGPQEAELKAFCRQHNLLQVRFLGQIDRVPELFSAADLVVVPSEWDEAFGFVVAESMACGTAVLVSDAGGLPEVVGGAGFIFRKGDVRDLSARLGHLMADPAQLIHIRGLAREWINSQFSLERMVDGYADIITNCYSPKTIAAAQGKQNNYVAVRRKYPVVVTAGGDRQ